MEINPDLMFNKPAADPTDLPELPTLPPGARQVFETIHVDADAVQDGKNVLQMLLFEGWEPLGGAALIKPVPTAMNPNLKRVGAVWFLRRMVTLIPKPANSEEGD